MNHCKMKLYGSSVLAERGQIVIPQDARNEMGLETGERFLFFGDEKMLHLVRVDQFEAVLGDVHESVTSKINQIKDQVNSMLEGEKKDEN